MNENIKKTILDEAGKIVDGARRAAYGTPENNFARIARFWQAYFDNKNLVITDRDTGIEYKLGPGDISPMMRLMKEARLCESPTHYDSHVDLVGYTLTGAEVNGVKDPHPDISEALKQSGLPTQRPVGVGGSAPRFGAVDLFGNPLPLMTK